MIYLYLIRVHTILWKTAYEVNNKKNINHAAGMVIYYVNVFRQTSRLILSRALDNNKDKMQ